MAKRLLLVEDEPALARAMARLFRRASFEVVIAGSCEEARQTAGTFSLGIFDIQLPDGDGVVLATELLKSHLVRRAVFFSGTVSGVERRRAERLGPFVEKGMGFSTLHAVVEQSLARVAKVAGAPDGPGSTASSIPPSGVRGNGSEKPN